MKNNTELKDTEQCLLELNLICPGTEFNELNYLQLIQPLICSADE